jgi:hypothetical protein
MKKLRQRFSKWKQEKVEALNKGGDAIADWENRVFADDLICLWLGIRRCAALLWQPSSCPMLSFNRRLFERARTQLE